MAKDNRNGEGANPRFPLIPEEEHSGRVVREGLGNPRQGPTRVTGRPGYRIDTGAPSSTPLEVELGERGARSGTGNTSSRDQFDPER